MDTIEEAVKAINNHLINIRKDNAQNWLIEGRSHINAMEETEDPSKGRQLMKSLEDRAAIHEHTDQSRMPPMLVRRDGEDSWDWFDRMYDSAGWSSGFAPVIRPSHPFPEELKAKHGGLS